MTMTPNRVPPNGYELQVRAPLTRPRSNYNAFSLDVRDIASQIQPDHLIPLSSISNNEQCLLAASEGNIRAIRNLIAAGADINAQDAGSKSSPLHRAVENGHSAVIRKLVQLGADVEQVDSLGRTPLFLAIERDDLHCARELLEANAHVDKAESRGWTPLHAAAESGNLNITRMLLNSGANPNAKSRIDRTPADISMITENYESAVLLIQAGGKVSESSVLNYNLNNPLDETALALVSGSIAHNQYNPESDLSKDFPTLINNDLFREAIAVRRARIQTELNDQFQTILQTLQGRADDATEPNVSNIADQHRHITQFALDPHPGISLPNLVFPDQPTEARAELLKGWINSLN